MRTKWFERNTQGGSTMTPNFWEVVEIVMTNPQTHNLNVDFNVGLSPDIWLAIIIIFFAIAAGNR